MKKIKFLLIASYPESVLKFRKELVQSILSRSISIHLVVPKFSNSIPDKKIIEQMGITIHQLPLNRNGISPIMDVIFLIKIFQIIKRVKPRYTLAYTIKPIIYGLMASKFARVPNNYALITGLGYGFTGSFWY